jgi:hypothetical protein
MRDTSHPDRAPTPITDDQLITPEEAAAFLGATPALLAKWRCSRLVPLPFVKLGRMVRYRVGDLREFIALRRQCAGD